MPRYEYRVITAPSRGVKTKGISSGEARFAHALEDAMNTMAREGWEYLRAETLPSTERTGATGSQMVWRNVLVFRRMRAVAPAKRPTVLRLTDPLTPSAPMPSKSHPLPDIISPQHPDDDASRSAGASRMLVDNGVEEWSEVSGISASLKLLAESRKSSNSDH